LKLSILFSLILFFRKREKKACNQEEKVIAVQKHMFIFHKSRIVKILQNFNYGWHLFWNTQAINNKSYICWMLNNNTRNIYIQSTLSCDFSHVAFEMLIIIVLLIVQIFLSVDTHHVLYSTQSLVFILKACYWITSSSKTNVHLFAEIFSPLQYQNPNT
jgi:hypothetical protein